MYKYNKESGKNIDIFWYIRNLKYAHLTTIFRLHNSHLVFSTCPHKYKWLFCIENPVLNARLKIRYIQHKLLAINIYLSSFSKKSDAKIYI